MPTGWGLNRQPSGYKSEALTSRPRLPPEEEDVDVKKREGEDDKEVNQKMFEKCGVKHRMSSAYHPQTNGLDERTNQTLKKAIGENPKGVSRKLGGQAEGDCVCT
ncbi:hypothetical protein AALO_G00224480 [Alosa alosa]|uniref:Reverse transcriptase domain-containing protein n=1 Tax=Alosa alosa TaxID=278164 RepID=A0AAV6FZ21_9TELE|nr:hypothetical protein AALO_G00224480 [Alosa alosa]